MAREDIIGRIKEQELLDEYVASGKSEFIAIYGRRRIGKTFLVKQYFDERFDFYITGIFGKSKREQLANFNRQLNKYSGAYYPMVDDWFDAFAQLQHYLDTLRDQQRIVVFLDELPWMDTPRSKFIRALELFWNEWGSSVKNMWFGHYLDDKQATWRQRGTSQPCHSPHSPIVVHTGRNRGFPTKEGFSSRPPSDAGRLHDIRWHALLP